MRGPHKAFCETLQEHTARGWGLVENGYVLQGDQGYMHVASSYASSVTGASAYDDVLAASAAAAEARSPPADRHRTQLEDALTHLGTLNGGCGGGGGTQAHLSLFGNGASPTAPVTPTAGSPPEHAPRPASGGWRPMDADAERESRVAAIRAEFRAVAQSVGAPPFRGSYALHGLRTSAPYAPSTAEHCCLPSHPLPCVCLFSPALQNMTCSCDW